MAVTESAQPLLDAARVEADEGVIDLSRKGGAGKFVEAAKQGRIWSRERS